MQLIVLRAFSPIEAFAGPSRILSCPPVMVAVTMRVSGVFGLGLHCAESGKLVESVENNNNNNNYCRPVNYRT